jgi:hypothetical protein
LVLASEEERRTAPLDDGDDATVVEPDAFSDRRLAGSAYHREYLDLMSGHPHHDDHH